MLRWLHVRTTESSKADNGRQMNQSPLQSVLRNIEQLSEQQRLMLKYELQTGGGEGKRRLRIAGSKDQSDGKTSSMVPVSAESVGQDGHGSVAGADVSGDVDGEPVGFERGASVDKCCGESSCE